MNLSKAANYFAQSPVSGWNGTDWDEEVSLVTLLPFDRFISEREFGNKRRHLLVPEKDPLFHNYSVIRFDASNEVYLVGLTNHDIFVDVYSQVVLVHRAQFQGTLHGWSTSTAASGMKKGASRSNLGTFWCDTERVTVTNSPEFDGISFSQMTVTLPRDCPADTDNEIAANGKFYDLKEVNTSSGFIQCRAIQKRS